MLESGNAISVIHLSQMLNAFQLKITKNSLEKVKITS